MEKLFELKKICEKSNYENHNDYEKYHKQELKISELKLDFAFILDMVSHSQHGSNIVYWYNEWNRMGRGTPLGFMAMNGLIK